MRAAVCYEPGEPLIIGDIDIDPPQSSEVKVRLVATTICHRDIHALHGDWKGLLPFDLLPGPESKIFEAIDSLLVAVSSVSMWCFLVRRLICKNTHGTLLFVFPLLLVQSL